jgi:hypothetical protein
MPWKHPELHKEQKLESQRRRRAEMKTWWTELKKRFSCQICGESDIACLDFHHTGDDKLECVSEMVKCGRRKERILNEISKCIVLCSNCHRKLHYYGDVSNETNPSDEGNDCSNGV